MSTTHSRSFPSRLYRALKHSRGAAMAEYMPVLFLVPIIASAGFQLYGGTLRAQLGQMADQIASNYYQGWFYPVIRPLTPGGTGTGSPGGSGAPTAGEPLLPVDGDGNPIFPEGPVWGGDPDSGNPDVPAGGGDQTCDLASTASSSPVSSAASTNTRVGNPIDFGNGNKFQQESDYRHFSLTPLVFERYYNSLQSNIALSLGHGWRHSYQRQILVPDSDVALNSLTVVRDDGTVYLFAREGEHWFAKGVVDQLQETAEGWLYTTVYGHRETYNRQGKLQSIHYTNGVEHRLDYSDGQLTRISDSRGPSIRLHYSDHWLARVELPNRQVLRYRYSEQGNLAAFQRVASSAWSQLRGVFDDNTSAYHYEDHRFQHGLTGITDAEGRRFATWGYDRLGRANLSEHGQGVERYTIEYRSDNSVATTNAAGLITIYHLEQARPGYRRLVSVEGQATPTCPEVRKDHRYNEQGFLKLAINTEGHALKMVRNDRGLIEQQEDGLTLQQGEWLPVQGSMRTERSWHPRLPLVTREIVSSFQQGEWQSWSQADMEYSDAGRLLKRTHTDLSRQTEPYSTYGNQRSWTYEYTVSDKHANQLASMRINGPRQPLADGSDDVVTHHFNQQGLLESIVNPLGHTTQFKQFDANGLPVSAVLPNGTQVQLAYNQLGLIENVLWQGGSSALTESTAITYNRNGLIKQLTLADGSWQRFEYNDARQLIEVKNSQGEILAIVPSKVSGDWTTQIVYSSEGYEERRAERGLDSLGRVIKLLGQHGQETSISYTKSGRQSVTKRKGHAEPSKQHYDSLNHLTGVVDALLGGTRIEYGTQGLVSKVIDPESGSTEYKYNGFGEIIWQRSDAEGESTFYRDNTGNLTGIGPVDNPALRVTLNYDLLNRLIKVDYSGSVHDVYYQYDQVDDRHGNGLGRLTQLKDSNAIHAYTYDDFGRLVADKLIALTTTKDSRQAFKDSETDNTANTIRYQYREGGQLKSLRYANGAALHYRYTQQRLTAIDYQSASGKRTTIVTDIKYGAYTGPQQWQYGNGLVYQQQLDVDGRVQALSLIGGDKAIWQQDYDYNQLDNIVGVQKATQDKRYNLQYAYDDLGRLTDEQQVFEGSSLATGYHYNAVGNRTLKTTDNQQIDYRYGPGGRLIAYDNTRLTQDAKGNTTGLSRTITGDDSAADERQHQYFIYDHRNHPIAYYQDGSLQAEYRYNAFRQRTQKTLADISIDYRYNLDGQLITEQARAKNRGDTKQDTTHYVWLGQTPVAQITTSGDSVDIVYLHADHLNTPRMASNQQQQIVWQWHSDAFGVGQADEDPDSDGRFTSVKLRFPGQYYDRENGLFYNYHRYYDPATGRYTQSDPIGLAGGLNTYAYVSANPLSNIDPLGLLLDTGAPFNPVTNTKPVVPLVQATQSATLAQVRLLLAIRNATVLGLFMNSPLVTGPGGAIQQAGLKYNISQAITAVQAYDPSYDALYNRDNPSPEVLYGVLLDLRKAQQTFVDANRNFCAINFNAQLLQEAQISTRQISIASPLTFQYIPLKYNSEPGNETERGYLVFLENAYRSYLAAGGDLSYEDWVADGMPSAAPGGAGQQSYQIGQSDGGPGTWQSENGLGSRNSAYQAKVTGAPERQQYIVPDPNVPSGQTSFDGYNAATNILIDAKCWTCWPIAAQFSIESVVTQAIRQQTIAKLTGTTVEWHVPTQDTADMIMDIFEDSQYGIDLSIITVVVTPE